jgi:hypothetical protein
MTVVQYSLRLPVAALQAQAEAATGTGSVVRQVT